jgi:DNA replication protein DnaC
MISNEEMLKFWNEQKGNLNEIDGIQCDVCNNRGFYYILKDDEKLSVKCDCMKRRSIQRIIIKSGLKDNFIRYTFNNFTTENTWQKYIKDTALDFIKNHSKKNALGDVMESWYIVAGQVGSGKSHICTAISKSLIDEGYNFKYFAYATDMPRLQQRLKSGYMDVKEEAEKHLEELKTVRVLYIDDFMKTRDINNVFELIDYRYGKNNLITIISTEKNYEEQRMIDEAVASRIKERTGNKYYITIGKDTNKNVRMT